MPEINELRRTIETASGGPRSVEITMGAAGPRGLVAWIESRDEIATLFVAGQGRILLARSLARADTLDFGYEGCSAQHLAWYGDRLVVVSSERGSYLRSVDPERGGEEGVCFSYDWRIDRDLVLWVDHDPGLLCTAALPSLDARPPLPFRGNPASGDIRLKAREDGRLDVLLSRAAGSHTIDTLVLPADRQRAEYAPVDGLLDVIERRLFPAADAPMAARLIIAAVAHPFVRGAQWRARWQPVPVWMPVYWQRYLASTGRASEAGEIVDLLDAIAAPLPEGEPEYGWDPGWSPREGQIELAVRYVRRQARILAGTCRSGVLPPGWWCLLFDPAPQSSVPGSRVDPAGFPPILRRVFEDLARTRPERLPESW
ncbi:MAG: hypothetical protein HYR60_05525 [Acidobacteria bacterium]|nr:hypothetical protein [Acidobacteriota bacterium]